MRLRLVLIAGILAFPLFAMRAVARTSSSCEGGRGPSITQLQGWTRAYYPSLAEHADRSARLVVGYILDERCAVVRHSAGVLPRGEYSEDVVLTLFPGLKRRGEPAGLADAVPPARVRGQVTSPLVAAWIVMREPTAP